MHGIKRDSFNITHELEELKGFISIRREYESWKSMNDFTDQKELGYDITRKFLILSPENISAWNSRKKLISLSLNNVNQDICKILQEELLLTFEALKRNTKSYSTWFHRKWILQQFDLVTSIDWNKELELLSKLLDIDDRNFHAWGYRQWILSKSNTSHQDKLSFTKKKISQNFSNYSAWHTRSKLLTEMMYDNDMSSIWIQESDWIKNAYFTEPRDSSPWYYFKWLIDIVSKYCIKSSFLGCHIDQKEYQICFYHSDNSYSGSFQSILTIHHQGKISIYNGIYYVFPHHAPSYYVSIFQSNNKEDFPSNINELYLDIVRDTKVNIISFNMDHRSNMALFYKSFVEKQRNDLLSLTSIEPDTKWAKYQLVNINMILGARYEESIEILQDLATRLDPIRSGHYNEVKSWVLIEQEKNTDLYLDPILSPIKYINDSANAFISKGDSLPLNVFWLSGLVQCRFANPRDSFLWPSYYPRLVYQRIF